MIEKKMIEKKIGNAIITGVLMLLLVVCMLPIDSYADENESIPISGIKATVSGHKVPGGTIQCKFIITPTNASVMDLEFSIDEPSLAEIGNTTVRKNIIWVQIKALKAGKVTLTAKAKDGSNKEAQASFVIIEPGISKVSTTLGPDTPEEQLAFYDSAGNDVAGASNYAWLSSNTEVVTVNKGKLTAVANGTARIHVLATKASSLDEKGWCTVEVKGMNKDAPDPKDGYGEAERLQGGLPTITWSCTKAGLNNSRMLTNLKNECEFENLLTGGAIDPNEFMLNISFVGPGKIPGGSSSTPEIAAEDFKNYVKDKIKIFDTKGNCIASNENGLNFKVVNSKTNDNDHPEVDLQIRTEKNILKSKQFYRCVLDRDIAGPWFTTQESLSSDLGLQKDIIYNFETGTVPVQGISIDKTSLKLEINKQAALKVSFSPDNATEQGLSWKSSNPQIASVDQNGRVKGIKAGSAVITVNSKAGNYKASCNVTVKRPTTPMVKAKAKSVSYNTSKITWNKAKNVTGYEVYRADSKSGHYKKIKTLRTTSYKNTRLKTGKTYYYKIRAYKVINGTKYVGSYSKRVAAKIIPETPKLKLSAGKHKVSARWSKVKGADGYQLYRSAKKTGKYSKMRQTAKSGYTDKSLKSKKQYYYKARAYRIVSGKKVYSSFTPVQKVKTK